MICRTAIVAAMSAGLVEDPRPNAVGYVDSAALPARCHWADEADASLCDIALAALEVAWPIQVNEMGFYPPMPDDDGLLDLYITEQWTGGGAYALGSYADEDTEDGRMGSHAYIALAPSIGPDLMASYVDHEFNHVLQYGTDFTENLLVLWEGTANIAAWYVHPDVALDEFGMNDFQATPWAGLMTDGYRLYDDYGLWSYYEYGAMLWNLYLEAGWGGSGQASAALWALGAQDGWDNEPDMLDALDLLTGDWRAALLDFSAARVRVGTPAAPEWIAGLDDPSLALDIGAEVDWAELEATGAVDVTWPEPPFQTGAVYVRVTGVPDGTELSAQIDAEASSSVLWGMALVWEGGSAVSETDNLAWTASPEDGDIVLGIVNLGDADIDGDDWAAPAELVLRLSSEDGVVSDTGDAGGNWDSGDPGAISGKDRKGCGCATSASSGVGMLSAALGLALFWARRREEFEGTR